MSQNENVTADDRGFIAYTSIIDSYGANVRVKESSRADGPYVWVFIEGGIIDDVNDGSAHLNIEQAKNVRDALSKWIDEIPSRWELSKDGFQ